MRILPKAPDLLRETAFRRYWFGQSLSLLGGQISMLAFPLTAVLALHASAEGVAQWRMTEHWRWLRMSLQQGEEGIVNL